MLNTNFACFDLKVKEVAKLVKAYLVPKQEIDTCAEERLQLLKIQEEKV